jgi:glycosyltransferase involved in cell wall biosynthesis
MPKVLHIIARLNVGGTSRYLDNLIPGLQEGGYEVLVATGYVQGSEIEDDAAKRLPIHKIPTLGRKISPINDFRARRAIKKLIRDYNPDIIQSHTFKAGLLTRTFKCGIPKIHTFHGHLFDDPEFRGLKKYPVILTERLLASHANQLVTVGDQVARDLISYGIGKSNQFISIVPGVRQLQFAEKSSSLAEFGLESETRPIVVWMARVTAVKGPQRVIEIAKAMPDVRFLMVGGGDLFEIIQESAPENLTFLGWQIPEKVWPIADVALSTSHNEGIPISIIEAQMAAIPVVAVNAGAIAQIVVDGETGILTGGDIQELISGISTLVGDLNLRSTLGKNAKKNFESKFGIDDFVDEYLQIYSSLMTQKTRLDETFVLNKRKLLTFYRIKGDKI